VGVKIAEAAVGPPADSDAVPEPRVANVLRDDVRTPAELVARAVQVGALAHIVHLCHTHAHVSTRGPSQRRDLER
jgi:hypothetical protein